ncbi:MAG: hypothetical protein MUC35_01325 [Candidatus Margulisbacteria bacterium]|jgi:hypothetical protein|nr:hypothetical protein [Candidatus Margulisiibacteriota bacterium]
MAIGRTLFNTYRAVTTAVKNAPSRLKAGYSNWGTRYYRSVQGGDPHRPLSAGIGDGPKDLADTVPQLARWEEGGVEVYADFSSLTAQHPTLNYSRIGWAQRQAFLWYPHALSDIPLYVLPGIYWTATLAGTDFIPLVTGGASLMLYMGGFLASLFTYVGSHHNMGDTFLGDLIVKEGLLKTCGPGWVEGGAKAIAREGTPFAITPSGGDKNRLAGRTAFGLAWRFGISAAATLVGTTYIAANYAFPFLSGAEYALTLAGWAANTVFPFLNSFLIGFGIHRHHGYMDHGQFRSGWRYFWNELIHPFTGGK